MATNIDSLKCIELWFTRRGPGLNLGYRQAEAELARDRAGFLRLDAVFASGTVPVVMRREDLYLIGFQSSDGWWRFADADWPLTPAATSLGFEGRYDCLGGLRGSLTLGGIQAVGKLSDARNRSEWKEQLRTLLIVVAENLRLIPVQMQILGLLNGIDDSVKVTSLERYIHEWGKASGGKDMTVALSPNFRQGFRDPTIVKR